MCISCRPHVDVHKEGGGLAHVDACGQGSKIRLFCRRHKWMAPCVDETVHYLLLKCPHCPVHVGLQDELIQGRPSPKGNDEFHPCFKFSPISETSFKVRGKCSQCHLFQRKNFISIHQNF